MEISPFAQSNKPLSCPWIQHSRMAVTLPHLRGSYHVQDPLTCMELVWRHSSLVRVSVTLASRMLYLWTLPLPSLYSPKDMNKIGAKYYHKACWLLTDLGQSNKKTDVSKSAGYLIIIRHHDTILHAEMWCYLVNTLLDFLRLHFVSPTFHGWLAKLLERWNLLYQ